MANGANGSSRVASINAQIRGRSSGRGCADVGHISTSPELAISTSPSRSKDSTCEPRPANTNKAADAACNKCPRAHPRQRPAKPVGIVPLRVVVVAGEYRDQPARGAEQRQGTK